MVDSGSLALVGVSATGLSGESAGAPLAGDSLSSRAMALTTAINVTRAKKTVPMPVVAMMPPEVSEEGSNARFRRGWL